MKTFLRGLHLPNQAELVPSNEWQLSRLRWQTLQTKHWLSKSEICAYIKIMSLCPCFAIPVHFSRCFKSESRKFEILHPYYTARKYYIYTCSHTVKQKVLSLEVLCFRGYNIKSDSQNKYNKRTHSFITSAEGCGKLD